MASSLLERMNIVAPSAGPQRSKPQRNQPSPYAREPKNQRPDPNQPWTHDKFTANTTLLDRMGTSERAAPRKVNFSQADRALSEAQGRPASDLSIRGASVRSNVIDVAGLVKGTTADDVQAIFKQCGVITAAKNMPANSRDEVVVRLTFKNDKDAQEAIRKFNGQVADGKELRVSIVGAVNTTLQGRIEPGATGGSVDALLGSSSGTSKMRSDEILKDAGERARAQVLVAPPGTNPRDYVRGSAPGARGRGRGGRRRGGAGRRGGGGGAGRAEERMETD